MRNVLIIIAILLVLLNVSCREEEYEFVGIPPERGISAGSVVADLLFRTSLKDGSADNIIDRASCISLKLPVVVTIDDDTYTITDLEEDLEAVEEYLDEEEDENEVPELVFPITIILADHTEVAISNSAELKTYQDQCPDEDAEDDDIECIDFSYPLQLSAFNTVSEMFTKRTILNDNALNAYMATLSQEEQVTIGFPVQMTLWDDTQIVVEDIDALQAALELYEDDCDEDDNNSFLTPVCDDCSSDQFNAIWATCSEWEAHKFQVNDVDLKNLYEDYSFEFLSDGTVIINTDILTINGTWVALGTGNNITLEFNFLGLPDFNRVWNLKEIKEKGDDQIDVRLFDGTDELHIQSDCD